MIISRTPFRVSFFGGGTDYPAWFCEHGGRVLSTSIDKYCYISARYLPPFFEHRSRIVWSQIEKISRIEEIQHPAVRATLAFMKLHAGINIHHEGDLPARSGLGSSSAFVVGLLHSLHGLKTTMPSRRRLACEAIHVEQEILQENVGIQDQIQSSFGGFNLIEIAPDGEFTVHPMIVERERLRELESNIMLFFTGQSRFASDIAASQISAIPKKQAELHQISNLIDPVLELLSGNGPLDEFGKLLHESWQLKRSISKDISNDLIDDTYERARGTGALGGKLLGAGGGGFILLYVRPEMQQSVRQALKGLVEVPFAFEPGGTQIIYCDDNDSVSPYENFNDGGGDLSKTDG